MNQTPDGQRYWITIKGLTPGTEYAYQYLIDDSIQVADYNTEKVLDKNVDPGISSITYPASKSFPHRQLAHLQVSFKQAKQPTTGR